MSEEPSAWPIDLGNGFRAEWLGETLWLMDPGGVGPIRVPTSEQGSEKPCLWKRVSYEPAHVEPSIRVTDGSGVDLLHGHIRGGRWQPC